jgi:hypothetical protein
MLRQVGTLVREYYLCTICNSRDHLDNWYKQNNSWPDSYQKQGWTPQNTAALQQGSVKVYYIDYTKPEQEYMLVDKDTFQTMQQTYLPVYIDNTLTYQQNVTYQPPLTTYQPTPTFQSRLQSTLQQSCFSIITSSSNIASSTGSEHTISEISPATEDTPKNSYSSC